jgi:hypothetical protein
MEGGWSWAIQSRRAKLIKLGNVSQDQTCLRKFFCHPTTLLIQSRHET